MMQLANPTRGRFAFKRDGLPSPVEYFREQGLKLIGGGEWKSAVCPFHDDTRPSLRVHMERGAFKCMTCGAKGGDILAIYMKRYALRFVEAAKALGAWEGARAGHRRSERGRSRQRYPAGGRRYGDRGRDWRARPWRYRGRSPTRPCTSASG